jgi:hypothetical protein
MSGASMPNRRLLKCLTSVLGCWAVVACLALPAAPATAQAGAQAAAPAPSIARFELLANIAYGGATTDLYDLKLEPYGALFGFDAGYTWQFGLHVGAHFDYGLGRSVSQRYERLLGREVEFTSQGQSLSSSASLGYDLWLYFLILRYSLDLGVTWLRWDFGDVPYATLGGYSPMQGTVVGFQLSPRVALLWPIGRFECGLGMRYVVQFADQIPSGLVGELLLGVAL